MSDETDSFMPILLITTVLVVLFMVAVPGFEGCSDQNSARATLNASGFRDITVGGYDWFACGDDISATKFKATNPNGVRVEGVVCCGVLKACTVRF